MKIVKRIVSIALFIAFALGASVVLLQDRYIYRPVKAPLAEVISSEMQAWPTSADFRGVLAEPAGRARATVLVFHGNYGNVSHRRYYANALTRLGLRVIVAEYPGYGPRDGDVGESSLVADAAHTIELAHQRYGEPILVIGESLGAGVAAAASALKREELAGLWLITPWDRLENVASQHYSWLPVGLLLRDRYDSVANLATFGRPVLVSVAQDDALIPARLGITLYDTLPAPRRLTVIEGAGHNDWMRHVSEPWWAEAIDYLLRR